MSVKNVSRNAFFEDVPQLAVDLTRKGNKVLGFGARANLVASTSKEKLILNGFDHPRSIIGDFETAEKTLQLFLEKVNAPKKVLLCSNVDHSSSGEVGRRADTDRAAGV
jgi:hypothetical protein